MATYCVNHVDEQVERLKKLGKVKKTKTKIGMCGHLGGCNTDNLDLVELKCDYSIKQKAPEPPAKEEESSADVTEGKEVTETTTTASDSGSDNSAGTGEATAESTEKGTDAEEKPVEA